MTESVIRLCKMWNEQTEVKRSIRSQVLMVFFLPLLVAGLTLQWHFRSLQNL